MIFHQPVLLVEVLRYMNVARDRGYFCDCTTGGAGHLLAMLQRTQKAKFLGIEWDSDAISHAKNRIEPYKDRCLLFKDNFVNLGLILDRLGIKYLAGILFDLGVSYFQLTTAKRGFSFDRKGILSMTMSSNNPSLRQKLEHTSRSELIAILKEYGDVRSCRRIGSEIYENRKTMKTTYDLRQLVENTTPKRFLKKELHKVFQALRIWVNSELENLKRGLTVAIDRLEPKGRIVVISYHSGEDRIVKNTFRQMHKNGQILLLHKKVIKPPEDEIKVNPRARSAKLRVGERCVLS
jgi:16S rRNA (cytosine1402-N4)-methyltransferase